MTLKKVDSHGFLIIDDIIVYFTPKKYDSKVIPTARQAGFAGLEANEMSEVEESIELMKISRLRPSADGLRSK